MDRGGFGMSFYEVVTNNPRLKHIAGCVYIEGRPLDVLAMLRDKVHDGYRLISSSDENIPPAKALFNSASGQPHI